MSNCIKIVNPSVEFISEENLSAASHIAKCARVCYGKEYKAPDKERDEKMIDGLESRGHTSMFRHSSIYLKWDLDFDRITLFNVFSSDKLDEVTTILKENAFSNNFGNYISCLKKSCNCSFII